MFKAHSAITLHYSFMTICWAIFLSKRVQWLSFSFMTSKLLPPSTFSHPLLVFVLQITCKDKISMWKIKKEMKHVYVGIDLNKWYRILLDNQEGKYHLSTLLFSLLCRRKLEHHLGIGPKERFLFFSKKVKNHRIPKWYFSLIYKKHNLTSESIDVKQNIFNLLISFSMN